MTTEQNTTVATITTDDDGNVTVKPRKVRSNDNRTDFSKIIAAHAKRRNIDTTRAGKEIRARARREFDKLCKLDSTLAKVKSGANDGNRWPALNASARDHLLSGKGAK